MVKRLLIVSTLDSKEPFGAFTRPFYLGMYLSRQFEVCQIGIDCSAIDYAGSVSVGSRSLKSYIQTIQKALKKFKPDIVYAQETLPATAAWLTFTLFKPKKCRLVFDFHTFSAFEYWTRLSTADNKFTEFKQFVKTYFAQGNLIFSGRPIIAASESIIKSIVQWYKIRPKQIYSVSNGVSEDLLNLASYELENPYFKLKPAKIAIVIAPKTFSFPTNDMSVEMTIEIAKHLDSKNNDIHFVVIGRDKEDNVTLPSNITFTGFLPNRQDFLAHLKYADIGLLPFPEKAVAGGARNKSLDYLACQELVVISTPEGLRGLDEFEHQEHLLIADYSSEKIAQIIDDTCQNINDYQSLAQKSYELTKQKYSWSAMAEKVAKILNAKEN